jgi:hypothetical protein
MVDGFLKRFIRGGAISFSEFSHPTSTFITFLKGRDEISARLFVSKEEEGRAGLWMTVDKM